MQKYDLTYYIANVCRRRDKYSEWNLDESEPPGNKFRISLFQFLYEGGSHTLN